MALPLFCFPCWYHCAELHLIESELSILHQTLPLSYIPDQLRHTGALSSASPTSAPGAKCCPKPMPGNWGFPSSDFRLCVWRPRDTFIFCEVCPPVH